MDYIGYSNTKNIYIYIYIYIYERRTDKKVSSFVSLFCGINS